MEEMVMNMVGEQVLQTLQQEEAKLDAKINELENMEEDDIERLRQRRRRQLMQQQQKRQEWRAAGHGSLNELSSQQDFFDATKSSDRLIVHFYRGSNEACTVMDERLRELAQRHLETKICRIDAEKAPYLCERLNIWMLPTLLLVKKQQTIHGIVGLDELGGSAEALTWQILEYVISQYEQVIQYDGPPPEAEEQRMNIRQVGKSIRRGLHDDELEDDY